MANLVIASNSKAMSKLDGSIKNKVYDFFEKLNADDTQPSLHIEPLHAAIDPRVRTGRVDLHYRAVLFRVDDKSSGPTYIYMGTWGHDEAIKLAERATLRVNPINGTLEGLIGEPAEQAVSETVSPVRVEKPAVMYLAGFGYKLEDLTEGLGLSPAVADRAMAAPDEAALLEAAEGALDWEGSALLDLATGIAISDIREKHGFTEEPVDPSLGEDAQIIKALERPASKMQFAFIEDNEELRRIIEGGDFAAWRIFLHPEQRKYVDTNYGGAFRLSGGAGTGKTVVAIHRARRLARDNPQARIVLTTYNRTLADGLKADLRALDPEVVIADKPGDPGVYVGGLDALGKAVLDLSSARLPAACESLFGRSGLEISSKRTDSAAVWRDVVQTVDSGLDTKLATPAFLDTEYIAVVLANRITTLEQYAKVARPGRGVRLSRPQRIAVWKLVDAYRRQSQMDETISFPEVLALAAEALRLRAEDGGGYLVDHVIVDEAQDLHATHWALLRALVAEGTNDLFIAEDSHQRIYGSPVVLGRFGIKIVGRSRRLTLNYRTTAQNLRFAMGVLAGADYRDLEQGEEKSSDYRSARNGPVPELIACPDQTAEIDTVATTIKSWLDEGVVPENIAVLTRSQDERDRFVRGLGERGVSARALDKAAAGPGHPLVLTMHRAKGMEFSRVILSGADDKHVPAAATMRSVPEEERAEALLRERSLLYVASSRARDALVVTWSGKRSELLGSVGKTE
ncbi:DNA helicase UvrD [Mycobacteroides abscessus]|uniref:3'-5' exonuclease n=1 Tax=Mycobacteroides abscessus TaxID=36809 RepID=UPI000C25F7AD|nr:3'-5' exonuclease [Mycobacteroides abscessus]PVA22795.1 DNA helicase UvrD [Mycobacteroides abscessus]PVA83866.1 DNA helicase UvrD [Mycobacteroides abscessus]RIR96128.1 DNA helicase UvrD [Mycobacteroides abscessus]RIS07975.1 DNA helicase UvrD [Mycobacteroides abscessus]RIS15946.1 DNA helicase UvrD [Mycobacteroides abscessus]